MNKNRRYLLIILIILIAGCLIFPIPRTGEPIYVVGKQLANNDLRSKITVGKSLQEVKTLLGKPIVNLGPDQVLVYQWAEDKGLAIWIIAGPGGGDMGGLPVAKSYLFLIALGPDKTVLKTETVDYEAFGTITGQIKDWLSANGLKAQVVSPKIDQNSQQPKLVIYRPSWSSCGFMSIDFPDQGPTVSIDDQIVGEMAKGEYLVTFISSGQHEVTFDSYSDFRHANLGLTRRYGAPITVTITSEQNKYVYIETSNCEGGANLRVKIRDEASALETIRDMDPAW